MKKSNWLFPAASGICLLLMALVISSPAQGTPIVYTFTDFQAFTGNASNIPDVTATITDGITSGTVQITMTVNTLPSNNTVTEWYFNVSLLGLSVATDFSHVGGTGDVAASSITVSNDKLSPQNNVNFDILFSFPKNGSSTLGEGNTSTYIVSHLGLTAAAFDVPSQGGDKGPFYSAIKQGSYWGPTTNPDPPPTSPTSPIPEPSVLLLLGSGLVGLVAIGRKFKK